MNNQDHLGVSNKEFCATNMQFIGACENSGIEPTKRQASKFRNRHGVAYKKLRYFYVNPKQ